MNDRDFQAWADAIDNRPSYGSRTAGRILYMGEPVEKRFRQVPAWKRSAARRQYELRQMRARIEMEELV
jgi:hypothetical protein